MRIVIAVSLGTIGAVALVVWLLFNLWFAGVKRRRLAKRRARQETARLKAMERALRPSLWRRLRSKGNE